MKKIISASVTPFTAAGGLDLESAARLYEFNLKCGVDGFFIPGSMGEWALLTPDERDALVKNACAAIGDRAWVMLGVQDLGLPAVMRNLERWSALPHSHWVVLFPSGWAGPADPVAWLHRLADAADRPLFFYYIPQFNGVSLSPGQFRDILAHPRIVGVKNSCDSMRIRRELLLLKQENDFLLMEGQEWSIDEALILGCDGTVAGFASAGGKLMKAIARRVEAGDFAGAQALQEQLIRIFHGVYGRDIGRWSAGQKYALQYLGVLASHFSRIEAQRELSDAARAEIRACVDANRDALVP